MKLSLVIALASLVGAAFAAGPKEGQKPGPGMRRGMMEGPANPIVHLVKNPRVAKELGLTDEQQKKIAEVESAEKESTKALQKSLRESMKTQAELLRAEKIDEAAVMAEIDKAFEARKELAKAQTRRLIAVKSILTPEQVQKALELMRNRPKRGPAKPETLDGRGKPPMGECPKGEPAEEPVSPKA